jgi:Arc/MetJ family transcription regulator
MRTTLVIDENLIEEARALAGSKSKSAAIETALMDFIRRKKSRKLLELEGKIELSYTLNDLLRDRKKDVPDR